ncbi:MAG: 2OG-Fe(II) oxygenase, partial [Noviherbaspirillum sp.]
MPTTSALTSLPSEWQAWINENLARACEPGGMADVMVRDGHFDARLARTAIEEARQARFKHLPGPQPMPEISTSANVIQTPDREVHVLLALQTPRVVLLGNVLDDEECDALIAYGDQRLERSPVVGDGDGKDQVHSHRTSRGAMLQRAETPLIARIEARLAALTRWPAERGEGLQML